jgi:hypothetical protein
VRPALEVVAELRRVKIPESPRQEVPAVTKLAVEKRERPQARLRELPQEPRSEAQR